MNVKRVKIGFKPNDVELKIVKKDIEKVMADTKNVNEIDTAKDFVLSEEHKEYQRRRKEFQ